MSSSKGKRMRRVKQVLPWVGTALLLAYLGWTTDLDAVSDALASVNIPALLALGTAGVLSTFLTDSYCVGLALSRFVLPVSFRESLPMKATSYFLNVLNYNVALVGMAFYLQRSRQAPFWKSLGSLFFLNVMDVLALCVMLAVGLLISQGRGVFDQTTLAIAWTLVGGGLSGFSLVYLLLRLNIRVPVVSRILKLELLAPFAQASIATVLHFVALRIFFACQYLIGQYFFLQLFGIDVPFELLFAYMPLLTFVQIVPISISGLGTTQLVMRHFYASFVVVTAAAPEAVVDAASTTMIFVFLVLRLLVAYVFFGDLSREVIEKAGRLEGQ